MHPLSVFFGLFLFRLSQISVDKLQFIGSFWKVLVELFQKLALIQRAERWSPPQRRNSFIRVSFLPSFFLCASSAKEKSGQTVAMRKMGFAFLHKAILCSTPAFLLTPLAQKKSLAKENAVDYFARCDERPPIAAAPTSL